MAKVIIAESHGIGAISVENGDAEMEDTFMDHDHVAVASNLVEDIFLKEGAVTRNPPETRPRHTALSRLHDAVATHSETIALVSA
jgi:hypothetical protein